jgi:hemolysin activation/secretion protein
LNAFGAGLQLAGDPHDRRADDFWIARAQLVRITQFGSAWSLRFDVLAQESPYVLPDSERFKIGGERLGRGFDVPEIAGDQGIGGKVELRRDLPALVTRFGGFSAYGYYDFAATWKQDVDDSESATTCGAGLSLQGKRASGYLEVAKPLTHGDIEGKRDTSVFLDLTMRF